MQDCTEVMDLRTGHKTLYSLPPEKAVVCAFEQVEKHNNNTWDYDYSQAVVSKSGKTVCCGDFAAPMIQEGI